VTEEDSEGVTEVDSEEVEEEVEEDSIEVHLKM
jgi:hypothetical protein